ncbi:MAG TPA: redoxin domain-containing protein [Pyrinomonadaceae bacterium]
MDTVLLLVRLVLFAVFAVAAIGKFLDLEGSEKAVKDFGMPADLAKPFAVALPFAEIVFAFCFLFTSMSWVGAIGGLILLLSFTGGMIWQMAQGRAPDCHCFGQIHSEPVSRKSLIRNVIFSVLALFLVAQGRDNQGLGLTDGDSNTMELVLIILAVALISAALFYLKKVLDNQNHILRRLELLEVISREGVPQERNDAGHPQDGLPIGSPFPDFELPNTSNGTVRLKDVLAKGRPAMFFFVSPTCEPCRALLPDMERWEAELGEKVNFVLVSNGSVEANREKLSGVFDEEVILQKSREIADAVRARWTPTALFVRSDGTIGSHLAAGDVAIRELIEKVRSADLSGDSVYFVTGTDNGSRQPKIGETLPDFSLPDINGREIKAADFRGKKTLAVFWSLTCPHCTAMMNDLKAWNDSRGEEDPELLVFSDGEAADHKGVELRAPILLDKGYKTAEKLGMFGTPSAVVLDADGRIASETGVGAANIWALLGRKP